MHEINPDSFGLALRRTHNDEYALLGTVVQGSAVQGSSAGAEISMIRANAQERNFLIWRAPLSIRSGMRVDPKTNQGLHETNPNSYGLVLRRTHNDEYALLETMMRGNAVQGVSAGAKTPMIHISLRYAPMGVRRKNVLIWKASF